jgi:phosphonopyruvate decarboxylase
VIPRPAAVATIVGALDPDDLLVTTTGFISRETFNALDRPGNFYMLGSMGLASALALGLALERPRRRVVVLEGDGSALMSLGTLPLIASERPANLVHVILDNQAYESTGAQPSITTAVDLAAMGQSAGYRAVARCTDRDSLARETSGMTVDGGPSLIVVETDLAPGREVPRVSRSTTEIRDTFRRFVHDRS